MTRQQRVFLSVGAGVVAIGVFLLLVTVGVDPRILALPMLLLVGIQRLLIRGRAARGVQSDRRPGREDRGSPGT